MAKTGIPYYTVKNGNGFWEPNARMRALGFHSVACGPDSPQARAIAYSWQARWKASKPLLQSSSAFHRNARTGYVYFLRLSHRVKIGYSGKPISRIEDLETGLPERPISLAAVQGSMADERHLHRQLEAFRQKGEWFTASAIVLRVMTRSVAFGRIERSDVISDQADKAAALSEGKKILAECEI